jgi:hypothetical protein
MANEWRLRNVSFEVDDLQVTVDRPAADGYGLVGGIGQHESIWRMAYVPGPEGIIGSWPTSPSPVAPPSGSADTPRRRSSWGPSPVSAAW